MSFAYLTTEQRESLGELPFPVALPAELPDGWSSNSLSTSVEDEETDFELTLLGPDRAKVVFMATDGGVGDAVPGEATEIHKHPELGKVFVERYEEPDPDEFQVQWFEIDDCAATFAFRGSGLAEGEFEVFLGAIDLFEAD